MAADNNDTPDAVVLHVGTNDLTYIKENPAQLNRTVKQHVQLVQLLKQRYKGTTIMVSLILNRIDCQQTAMLCEHYNVLLSQHLKESQVKLLHPSLPQKDDYFASDGLHPSDNFGVPHIHWAFTSTVAQYLCPRLKVKLVGGKEVNKYFKENEFERIMTFVQSQALIKWLKSKVPLAQKNATSKLDIQVQLTVMSHGYVRNAKSNLVS